MHFLYFQLIFFILMCIGCVASMICVYKRIGYLSIMMNVLDPLILYLIMSLKFDEMHTIKDFVAEKLLNINSNKSNQKLFDENRFIMTVSSQTFANMINKRLNVLINQDIAEMILQFSLPTLHEIKESIVFCEKANYAMVVHMHDH